MHFIRYIYVTILLVALEIYSFDADNKHEKKTASCTNRFEYRHVLKAKYNDCIEVVDYNSICGETVTIAYSLHPPYIFIGEDGNVTGILPGMSRYHLLEKGIYFLLYFYLLGYRLHVKYIDISVHMLCYEC